MDKINLLREIRELKTHLAYSKNIGFFFGAGTSCALKIPNVEQLTTAIDPAADMASILPHNIKVFNLCYIKEHGLSKCLEKASEIRRKYFTGKMIIGKGPQIE